MNGVVESLSTSMANAPWPFLLDVLIKSVVVLVGAFAASVLLRRASASIRHHVWSMALASILILPLLTAALPAWQLPLVPRVSLVDQLVAQLGSDQPVASEANAAGDPAAQPEARPQPEPRVAPPQEPEASAPPMPKPGNEVMSRDSPDPAADPVMAAAAGTGSSGSADGGWGMGAPTVGFWLFVLWGSVAALLLGRLAIGALVASWITRTAEKVADPAWKKLTRRLARRLGISADVALVRNERTGMPMAWGLFRPVVLLPSDSNTWSEERRRVVLLHELAHLKRHDCQTQILAQIAGAIHWFNPLVWQAVRRLRAERERACDDLVLASGTKGTDYAQHLLEIARSMRTVDHAAWAAVSMAKPSQMEGRLMAILDSDRDRRSLTRVTSVAAVLLVAALVFPLAALQPWAEATEPRELTQEEQAELQRQVQEQLELQLQTQFNKQLELQLQEYQLNNVELQHQLQQQLQHQMQIQLQHQLQGLKFDEEAIDGLMAGSDSIRLPATVVRSMVRKALAKEQEGGASDKVVEAMISALSDEDAEIREQAAYSLGQFEDPRAIEPLANALQNDTEPGVREQAAWSLGMIEDAAAVPALSQALSDAEADVREQAAWALGMIEDESAVDALTQVLSDPDEDVREQAVWALGMIESEAAAAPLMIALGDSNAQIRSQAAWSLGMIEEASAVDALAGALQDTDPEVREQAAWALGMIEDAGAVSALGTALGDSESAVREQAAWSLGMIEDAAGVDPLVAVLAGDADPGVREQAAWALGMIEDDRALDALLDALENDSEKDVREMALWAIGMVSEDAWQDDAGDGGLGLSDDFS